MTRSVLYLSFALSLFLSSCGSSGDNIEVNVLTPPGEAAIKSDISTAMQQDGHKGVYFVVEELPNPVATPYVAVQGGDKIEYPNSAVGLDPTKAKFTIKTSQLDQSKPYIIRMIAYDANNTPTHRGEADCFIDFSRPKLNTINICFKEVDDTNNCDSVGFQDFAFCKD
ncbi:hypothetical protein MRY82_09605 [bacterium]|nr:hypothetical protein [bacterium]